MNKSPTLFLAVALFSSDLIADDNDFSDYELICRPKSSVGMHYDKVKKDWGPTIFSINHKYLVLKSDIDGFAYVLKDFDTNKARYFCSKPIDRYGYLYCGNPTLLGKTSRDFKINVVGNRYITGSNSSYFNVFPEKVRKKMLRDSIKANQKSEKEHGISIPNYEVPSDENSDTPFIEIGICEKL